MSIISFHPRPMNQPPPARPPGHDPWVWDGFLPRGGIALLTGVWKTGKTTLLAGLLDALGHGRGFLGRACPAGAAAVVSEESSDDWDARQKAIPLGSHVTLVSKPFLAQPTPAAWEELVGLVAGLSPAGPLALVVVDALAEFLPGRSESDPGTLRDFLRPLRRLAGGGTAVLVLHHPRRQRSEAGSLARGGGVLLGAADALLELNHVGRAQTGNRRRLSARARRPGAVPELVYEWVRDTPEFRAVPDDPDARFKENWEQVRALLDDRRVPVTHRELLADWPIDRTPPSPSLLYDWFRRAAAAKLVERTGEGTKSDPFRFALPGRRRRNGLADLPDLPDLGPLRRPGW